MKSFKIKSMAVGLLIAGSIGVLASPQAYAIDVVGNTCAGGSGAKICDTKTENIDNTNFVRNLVNTLLYLLGAVAVITLIIGGFTYITANGDAARVKRAKDIILYSVIGLVVAIMAWGIVAYTVGLFG